MYIGKIVKRSALILLLLVFVLKASAQKIDSIYFNLYTDSLKKGTFNYINVEGRYTDGRYLPLGTKELTFTASAGSFSGNSLYIDTSFKEDKIIIQVVSLSEPLRTSEVTIYIKKTGNTEHLPTVEEILGKPQIRKRRS
jgi:hypothetical protein